MHERYRTNTAALRTRTAARANPILGDAGVRQLAGHTNRRQCTIAALHHRMNGTRHVKPCVGIAMPISTLAMIRVSLMMRHVPCRSSVRVAPKDTCRHS